MNLYEGLIRSDNALQVDGNVHLDWVDGVPRVFAINDNNDGACREVLPSKS